jgi:hypothetical protein
MRVSTSGTSGKALSRLGILTCFLMLAFRVSPLEAQESLQVPSMESETTARSPASKNFHMQITQKNGILISLSADHAMASEIAAELADRTGIPVKLGPAMGKKRITLKVSDLTLEPALRFLSPRASIDFEFRRDFLTNPKAIYLLADSDPEPDTHAVIKNKSDALILEGNNQGDRNPSRNRT